MNDSCPCIGVAYLSTAPCAPSAKGTQTCPSLRSRGIFRRCSWPLPPSPMPKTALPSTSSTHSCSLCNKNFSLKRNKDRHERSCGAKADRPEPSCSLCGKTFRFVSRLQRHQLTVHGGARELACQHCPARFSEASHLRRHILRLHPEPGAESSKSFPCPHCESTAFPERWELQRHLNSCHSIAKTCRLCFPAVVFGSPKTWRSHLDYHKGRKRFLCSICLAAFSQESELRNHQASLHGIGKRWYCQLCPASFPQRTQVQRHYLATHPPPSQRAWDGPGNASICHYCSFLALSKAALADHVAQAHFVQRELDDAEEQRVDAQTDEVELAVRLCISPNASQSTLVCLRLTDKLPGYLKDAFPSLRDFQVESPSGSFRPGQSLLIRLLLPKPSIAVDLPSSITLDVS